MPRQPRPDLADIAQHIVQRGNDRQPCFFQLSDYDCYPTQLRECASRCEVAIHAYVLMTNHVHPRATPKNAKNGVRVTFLAKESHSDTVPYAYSSLRTNGEIDEEPSHFRAQAMAGKADHIDLCRRRLANLCWIMPCLSEPIERRANREDACSGKFLEGRFLSGAAIVACMAYVDLNPVKAKGSD